MSKKKNKSKEEDTKFKILKMDTEWIKELIEQDNIKLEIEHETNFKNIFEGNDNKQKYECFTMYFDRELSACAMYDNLKKLGKVDLDFNLFPSTERLKIGEISIISDTDYCFECDERIHYIFDGTTIKCVQLSYDENHERVINKTSCHNIGVYSVDIEIPSGILMCDDWLPYANDLLKHLDKFNPSINSAFGTYTRTFDYAKLNVLHMFVGGSSPNVFYKDSTIIVGKYFYSEDDVDDVDDEYDYDDFKISPMPDGEEIAEIDTDLWWATIVDAEIYKKLLIEKFGEDNGLIKFEEIEKVKTKVKPGIYRCTYLANQSMEKNKPEVYIKMDWIKDIS